MRIWKLSVVSVGLSMAAVVFTAATSEPPAGQTTNAPAVLAQATNAPAAAAAEEAPMLEDPADEASLANAPVQPISATKVMPANLKLTPAAAEVLKLAQSGVEESVLLAFVTNSTSTFNLGAEDIIYFNDVGVADQVVAAMLQRDKELKDMAAAQPGLYAPQPVAPPAPTETATETAPPPETAVAAEPPAVYEEGGYPVFYDSLSPYGTWVNVGGWGPCWRPTVVVINPTWRPYCDGGRWVYSDCGWYWLSSYSWGWAPFHYGRWFHHSRMGWCWRPDTVWGPSWVSWRYGGNYCGWAPLPPRAGWTAGLGLTYGGMTVGSTFGFGLGVGAYTFVDSSHFHNRHLHQYALPSPQVRRAYHETAPSTLIVENNNRIINHGVPPSRIASATHTEVRPIAVRHVTDAPAPGGRREHYEGYNRTLSVFRPHFPSGNVPMPGSGGQPRSDRRSGNTAPALTPTTRHVPPATTVRPTTSTSTPQPTTPALGSSRPMGASSFSQSPTVGNEGTSTRTATSSRQIAPRSSQPIIMRGSDRSSRSTTTATLSAPSSSARTATAGSSARPEATSTRTTSATSTSTTPAPQPSRSRDRLGSSTTAGSTSTLTQPSSTRSATTTGRADRSPRASTSASTSTRPWSGSTPTRSSTTIAAQPRVAETPRSTATVAPSSPRTESHSVQRRSVSIPSYTAPASHAAAPSVSAPAVSPRTMSTPAPTPQPTRAYTPPSTPPSPRPQVIESRPAPSSPSSSTSSSSSSQSGSSSVRRGR